MEALIGQTIKGCYRVDALLGRGGMAEVYKVLDLQRGVPLAMKVLRDDLAEDRVFLRRFEREAHNLAKMQHPNIVRFYGLEQEKYLAFILMDYIQGPTLRKIIFGAEGPLKNQQVLEIMQPVCSALHYAHQQGIVHCDLKSANIMLDKGGKVYLTDFGIARMMDMATSTMVGIGTPAYMAPELIKGLDPTPQSDIYSLGIVLYEMLTGGERPFTGERATTTGTTAAKVRWEHLHLNAPLVSSLNPKVPVGIDAVIAKCLAKGPRQRYTRTLDVYEALAALLGTGQALAIKVNRSQRSTKDLTSQGLESDAVLNQEFDKQTDDRELEYDLAGFNPDDSSPILKEYVPDSKVPGKRFFGILLIALGISLLLYICVNSYKNSQERQRLYAEQTRSVHATSTASYEATATDEALLDIYDEVSRIEESAEKISLDNDKIFFELVESNSGQIKCKIVGQNLRKFILEAEFTNPDDVSQGWDYGFLFRYRAYDSSLYLLQLRDSGAWSLRARFDNEDSVVASGDLDNINIAPNSENTIRLVVRSSRGYLFVNGEFIDVLNVTDLFDSGSVGICTDLIGSNGINENVIKVDSVRLWKVP